MSLTNLPPEVRRIIYDHWLSGLTFKAAKPLCVSTVQYGLCGQRWLSDIFLVCKAISYDAWLTEAVMHRSVFHLQNSEDLTKLLLRFGADALPRIPHVSLSPSTSRDTIYCHIHHLMPRLRQVRLTGSLASLYCVWDYRLADFDEHPWAQFVTSLCVFGPGRTPGPVSILTKQVLEGQIDMVVDFVWNEPDFGTRRMQLSTKDWLLRYDYRGVKYSLRQVRPEDLELALQTAKGL